ncbi:MAG: MFS transporter [Actinomycetota bacterium]
MELSAPLRRPAFRRLASAYAINELGDWLGIVALAVLVFDRTDSALATTALFLGTRFVPALLAPAFVVRIERTPPRLALAGIYAGEAATFAVLALLVDHFSLAAVVVVATVDGTLALAGRSLTRAVVAALLEPAGELRSGNAIINMAFTAGAAVGPALGGVIVGGVAIGGSTLGGFGVQTALLLDALSFLVIAALMSAGSLPQAEPEEGRWRDRFRGGLAYVAARVPLRRLLIAQGAAFVFFTAAIPIEVIYAKSTLETGDAGYGALLASWGIGMVLGSVVFAAVRGTRLPVLLLCSTITIGVSYLGLAAAPTLPVACAVSVVGGVGNGIEWVAVVSAIQEMTRSSMQARVMSVLESIGAAMPGLGFVIGGLVATGHDPRAVFLVSGVGVLLVVAIATYYLAGTPWTKGEGAIGQADIDADIADNPDSGNVEEAQRRSVSRASLAGKERID